MDAFRKHESDIEPAVLGRKFYVKYKRAVREAFCVTWNISPNIEFALKPKKITEDLDGTGRQQHRLNVCVCVCVYTYIYMGYAVV